MSRFSAVSPTSMNSCGSQCLQPAFRDRSCYKTNLIAAKMSDRGWSCLKEPDTGNHDECGVTFVIRQLGPCKHIQQGKLLVEQRSVSANMVDGGRFWLSTAGSEQPCLM